jgi:ferredoxin
MGTVLLAIASVMAVVILVVLALWVVGERGHLLLPSTRRMLQPRPRKVGSPKQPGAPKQPSAHPPRKAGPIDMLHAYVYGRWTNQYIGFVINWLLPHASQSTREHWANSYHGKVLTPELATELILLDHDVDARDQEHIIPYPIAHDIVLKSPLPINLYECACRHARPNGGCKPTEVCMAFGTDLPDFLLDHNPHSARRITQRQALDILRAEHQTGHLHSAWFKDVLGNRMFAICNCCKCCCGGIEGMVKYGMRTMVSSGFVAAVDTENCTGCGICADKCPFGAMTLSDYVATVDRSKCMGCGVCQGQCAFEAIALVRDETKPAPLDVRML